VSAPLGILGAGWVGLVTAACFAERGHEIWVRDIDTARIEALERGEVPIFEPELAETLGRHRERIHYTLDVGAVFDAARIVFVCVGTPPTYSGDADMSAVWQVLDEIPASAGSAILVMKSTVPVGTGAKVRAELRSRGLESVGYVSNPEFLAESTAIHDFMHPDRVVVGAFDSAHGDAVAALYEPLGGPIVRTDVPTAEMIKYASNAFLATKVSFINEIANVCEATGADVTVVAQGMGYDKRIGPHFLRAGVGYSGNCLVGDETVLVRRHGRTQLVRLDALFAELAGGLDVELVAPDDLEVLAWEPGAGALFAPVALATRRYVDGEIVEVTTKMGRRIRCTPDHPLIATGLDGLTVKVAADLCEEDWLPIALGSPERDAGEVDTADLLEGLPAAGRAVSRRTATTAQVSLSSRILAGYWLGVLGAGASSYDHRIPDAIWSAPESCKRALLAGLWRGDGSWSYVAGGPSVVLEYSTVSRDLADGMLRLLGELGVVARVKVGRSRRSTCDTYHLVVSGADQIEGLCDLVRPEAVAAIRSSIGRQAKRIAPAGYRRCDDAAWVRVAAVAHRPYRGSVFSLEVPGPETFVTTGGLVVHNCLPKDVAALKQLAGNSGYHFQLLTAVIEVNELQKRRVIGKLEKHLGPLRDRTIAILGLAFKPNTNDMRHAASLVLAARLLSEGARVKGWDPVAVEEARPLLQGVELYDDLIEALTGVDAAVIVTEWEQVRRFPYDEAGRVMKTAVLVDGRNVLDPDEARANMFVYEAIGRPSLV
jgi:UDP-glucose 6-dehydrogenase